MSAIRSTPAQYRGVWFRSTLEADWAATFDHMDWYWEYEPVAVKLPDGTNYRPDFYLPSQRVWCEVKGPHNERMKKPVDLQNAVTYDWEEASQLVVILRPPGPGDKANWEGATDDQDVVLVRCPDCDHLSFMDFNGWWSCRRHYGVGRPAQRFWTAPGGAIYRPGEFPFVRAPR